MIGGHQIFLFQWSSTSCGLQIVQDRLDYACRRLLLRFLGRFFASITANPCRFFLVQCYPLCQSKMSTQCSIVCAEHPWRGTLRALLLQAEQSLDRRQLHLFAVDRRPSQVRSHQLIPAIAHLLIFSTSPASRFMQTSTVTISNPFYVFYGKAEGGLQTLQTLQTLPAFVSGPDSGVPSGPLTLQPCCLTKSYKLT